MQLSKYFFQYSIGLLCLLSATQFHYQLLFDIDEINDVWWNRMLLPKLEFAEVAVFQLQAQPPFRVG